MGYYRPLFRRPVYRDWPVIVGGWVALLAAIIFGVTRPASAGLGGPVLVSLAVFPAASWVLAFIRQRTSRWG